ncbi:MAG: hypothetical protein GXO81_10560 [Chlorobi bacterium]|nr:hypothetical protein [Chlorobiota bacterium]
MHLKSITAKFKTITTVLGQQQEIFETGQSTPDRVVSLSKAYIQPIVRGDEVKPVEFGGPFYRTHKF